MKALTYMEHGKFALTDKPKPEILDPRDAVVRVTLGSICTSDLHIKHGSVPRAVPGITVGHEMVGVVESVGSAVTTVKPGDRVTVNVETFCGECFFCKHGYVNNCTDPNGGWALGCRIDGGQAEFVRVPYADQGLNKIPDSVTDEQALFVGDVLATGFWAARISEITEDDTVLIIGAGPTGICTLLCVMLKTPKRIIVCEKDPTRIAFVHEHYPNVLVCEPGNCKEFTLANSDHGGADVVLEVAGAKDTFRLAWDCARPNAIVTVVALYDEAQTLPLPDMYGKNLTFKTGGVDGCDCAEILALIEAGKIDTTPLITHRYKLEDIEEAYHLFENKLDGVIKVAIEPSISINAMKSNNASSKKSSAKGMSLEEFLALADDEPSFVSNRDSYRIEDGVLYRYCGNDEAIIIPAGVQRIHQDAFLDNKTIKSVILPTGVKAIGAHAFASCNNLLNIMLPNGLESIEDDAFYLCNHLQRIVIPPTVKTIGNGAFWRCSRLSYVSLEEGLVSIGAKAFRKCNELLQITIPRTVNSIGEKAFYGCKSLHSVTLDCPLDQLGDGMFEKCAITQIRLPSTIRKIGRRAFYDCRALEQVFLPDELEEIKDDAFRQCVVLESIHIPPKVRSVGYWAFGSCWSLKNLSYYKTKVQFQYNTFYGCKSLDKNMLPK